MHAQQCLGLHAAHQPPAAAAAGGALAAAARRLAPCMREPRQRRGDGHVCQAHPRRVAKVASQIQREISEMFVYDDVLQRAICPDRGLAGSLSAIAGVTHVYVSNDLQVVKAYVSIYSDDQGKAAAMTNLKRLEPYVRSQIGQRVRLRLTPEVRFEYDDSIEEAELVQQVLGADEFERLFRLAAAGEGGAAFGGGEDEEEGGFFDLDGPPAAAAAAGGGNARSLAASAGGADEEEEEEEEEEYEEDFGEEEEYRGRRYDQPGPFDDLFESGGGAVAPTAAAGRQRQGQRQGQGQQRRRAGGARRPQRPGREGAEE